MRTMFAWLFVGLGLSLPVAAGNLNFLKDGPVGKFTDRDWEMMQETTRTALDNAPDGETVSWSNSDSGASGTIRPLETYDMDGMRCRRTELSNSAGDYPATANSTTANRQMASGKSPHRSRRRPRTDGCRP